jgi:hypothetical protein
MAHDFRVDDHLLGHEPGREVEREDEVGQQGYDENVTPILFVGRKGTEKRVRVLCNLYDVCKERISRRIERSSEQERESSSHGADGGASIARELHAWPDDTNRTRSCVRHEGGRDVSKACSRSTRRIHSTHSKMTEYMNICTGNQRLREGFSVRL